MRRRLEQHMLRSGVIQGRGTQVQVDL